MNGWLKWMMPVIVIIGIVFSVGYAVKNNQANIKNLDREFTEEVKEKKLDRRITIVEKDISYIKQGIVEIKAALR